MVGAVLSVHHDCAPRKRSVGVEGSNLRISYDEGASLGVLLSYRCVAEGVLHKVLSGSVTKVHMG